MIHEMARKIVWLGHDAFRIDGSKTVYFDPFRISGGPKADLVLISHDHFDHCSPDDVQKILQEKTVVVTESESARKLAGDVRVMRPGETLDLGSTRVEAVPSYNTDKNFHPKKNGWLGFILELDGVKVYHAGDSDFIPEMKSLKCDIALLPVSGTYVMNAEQAVKAALAMRPRLAIPMHYGAIVGTDHDALHFQKGLEGEVEVLILPKQT
jgi:L-ascorbate metabolism protein UlaG (beta-lactamase superfamily)